MYILGCLCQFHLHWVPNANPVSGGIWAIEFRNVKKRITPQAASDTLNARQTNIPLEDRDEPNGNSTVQSSRTLRIFYAFWRILILVMSFVDCHISFKAFGEDCIDENMKNSYRYDD